MKSDSKWSWVKQVNSLNGISNEHVLISYGLDEEGGRQCKSVFGMELQLSELVAAQYLASWSESSSNNAPRNSKNKVDKALDEAADLKNAIKEIRRQISNQKRLCQKHCVSSNPRCLNVLGMEKWLDRDKALEQYYEVNQLYEREPERARLTLSPVGLRNLGATCYVNAFLQTWYFDLQFRGGIFGIQSQDKESPIYQLQLLFGHLSLSQQAVYNPAHFVQSLGLNMGEQQDANEFYRLFVSLLERYIDTQVMEGRIAQNFLRSRFGGQYAHSTVCSACGNISRRAEVFTQIELNIVKANASIQDCLADYLKQEMLCDDNQYFCSVCEGKQDATRFTEFLNLPAVLNFQLLRFQMDFSRGELRRKKVTHAVKFPLVLDMAEYVDRSGDDLEQKPNVLYQLHAVLLHKGESAYSGHYIAHVYDRLNARWVKCNDEECGPLLSSGTRSMFDVNADILEDSSISSQQSTSQQTYDDDGKLYSSKNAYMLIYIRQDQIFSDEDAFNQVPQSIADKCRSDNQSYEQKIATFNDYKASLAKKFEDQRRLKLEFSKLADFKHQDKYVFIPTQWLQSWLSISKQIDDSKFEGTSIEMSSYLCQHGKLDLSKVGDMKIVSAQAANLLTEQKIVFNPFSLRQNECLCQECVKIKYQEYRAQFEHDIQVQCVRRLIKLFDSSKKYDINEVREQMKDFEVYADVMLLPQFTIDGPAVWISQDVLSKWLSAQTHVDLDHSLVGGGGVLCQHGQLNSDKSRLRLVPHSVYQFFQVIMPDLYNCFQDIDITENAQSCRTCTRNDRKLQTELDQVKDQAAEEKRELKSLLTSSYTLSELSLAGLKASYHLLPAQFVEDWSKFVRRPDTNERPIVESYPSLFCPHKRLRFDPSLFAGLKSVISQETGQTAYWWWRSQQQSGSTMALRPNLPLVNLDSQILVKYPPFSVCSEDEFKKLVQFYPALHDNSFKFSMSSVLVHYEQTDSISNDTLMAKYDSKDSQSYVDLYCQTCWKQHLLEFAGNVITLYFQVHRGKPVEDMLMEVSQYRFEDSPVQLIPSNPSDQNTSTTISAVKPKRKSSYRDVCYIDVGNDVDDEMQKPADKRKKLKTAATSKNASVDADKSKQLKLSFSSSSLQSPTKSGRLKSSGLIKLQFDLDNTVRDLKVKLMNLVDASPINQRLFLLGKELEANERTLRSYDVLDSMKFDVLIIPDNEEHSDFIATDQNGIRQLQKKENGFLGTALVQQQNMDYKPSTRETICIADSDDNNNTIA
ncbi:hypothetical protein MIR68_001986 [Amoeboaphelidium protococcarum]|nr:hypothetical protein MIR68_001986 [Amoeboaphelidium protococcarum]